MTAPHLGPGHSIAQRYTVRALMGFTGEVATYHAVSNDGREMVVKLWDPGVGQRADVMAHLDRVRQQIAQLPPAGVVIASDVGYDQGTGAPFSATEYLQIPSLAKLVETGPLSPDVVAHVSRGVAQVLDTAHGIGLHHLAIKPTNVFIGPAPHYSVRITDFDVSVIRRTSPATHEVYSQSAPWWAPEQLQPAAVLGPAADVFASALLAFYALAGRPYWVSCQTAPPDLPNWQIELMGHRVPVSQRARELGAVINPLFDGVFGRALSVNQPDRPRSAMELANVLASATSTDQAPQTMAFPDTGMDFGPGPTPYLAGASDQGGYVATSAGAAASSQSYDTQAATALPPFPAHVQRKQASPMLPIIIGITAAVLIGGGGMAFLFTRSGASETAVAAGSASAEVDGTADGTDSNGTGPDSAGSGSDGSGDASKSAEPAPTASATPEATTVSVWVRCSPACDRVELNGKAVEKPNEKLELEPGKYKIALVKQGYLIHKEEIEVVADKPIDKEIKLIKFNIVKPPPGPKNCGQFLCP